MKVKLTVVVLTKNETLHIQRVIENVQELADKIIVLDSYSEDDTVSIAKKLGAEVIFRTFDNYKNQRQHAIEYCKHFTEWLLFLDADEYLLEDLKAEVKEAILDKTIAGYSIPRRAIVMGKWIKYGGYYPTYLLRLFQPELASVDREINEHITVRGAVKKLKHDFVDHNLNSIGFWIDKHNQYAAREAESLLECLRHKEKKPLKTYRFSQQSERKRWVRENIWYRLPMLIRPFCYFVYRYIFRLGFLDGKIGLCYHFLQACWFQFLIDVKCIEKTRRIR